MKSEVILELEDGSVHGAERILLATAMERLLQMGGMGGMGQVRRPGIRRV